MSEELLQRGLLNNPEKIGKWDFYNIGNTTVNALKRHGIILDKDYSPYSRKKVDGLIVKDKKVLAVIENKVPGELSSERGIEEAIKQEIDVAKKLEAKVFIVTDTTKTIWVNPANGERIKDEKGNEIKTVFNPHGRETIKLLERIEASINESNSQLKQPELKDPLPLAEKVWQDLWSVSGATPENCLYTFVELFIFKYLSDLKILKGLYSFDHLLSLYNTNSDEEVLEYYAGTIRKQIKELFPASPIDGTSIINGTIFVSKDEKAVVGYSTVFRKTLDRFKNFGSLEYIDYDFKSKLFETFLKESISKKNWGQFFTPLKVVRAIIKMTEIKEDMKICDPACGVGKFLLESILRDIERFYKIDENGHLDPKIEIIGFDKGFDKEEQRTIILAKANMLIYFSNFIKENIGITKEFADLFNRSFILKTNSILGTLSDPKNEKYDLILTNPPYVTSGSSNLKEEIKKSGLEKHYTVNGMGVEGLFMEWIIRALKKGAKAFIVVPDGILNRVNDNKLRRFILEECYLDAIISLPVKTFFTNLKKTYIMAITKKYDNTVKQTDPVFTYLVSEIGETLDIYRKDIEENHLEDAVALFNQFKGAKTHFSTDDKRCKIQPIEKFDPDGHWSVDRWWTQQEKIELGIIEEEEAMTVEDFRNYIGEISDMLISFQEPLAELAELGVKKNENRRYVTVSLNNEDYFELFIGKRVLKKDLPQLNGDIPLYSANVFQPFGFVKESNIDSFDYNYVLWGIDGEFEFNVMEKGTKFATTDHCGAIRLKNDNIYPYYLMYQLYLVKNKYGFDRGLRSSLKNMANVEVEIPIDDDGNFDFEAQKELTNVFLTSNEIKEKLREEKKRLTNIVINIENALDKYKEVPITELFEIKQGNAFYTKKRILSNNWEGDVPVYSSNTKNGGLLIKMRLDKIDPKDLYYQQCLTWSIDGYAGVIFVRNLENGNNEKDSKYYFTINNHCGIFLPKVDNLYLPYIKHYLQPIFFKRAKGYGNNKLGTNQIEDIMIKIPVDDEGNYDYEKQREIMKKHEIIEGIQKEIGNKLDEILSINLKP